MENNELRELVHQKVENLRPKLLDLTRRNPLLSTKLTPRSNAHIRVVDELPDVLFYNLKNGQQMRLVPLPEINEDPKDENTKEFGDALSAARLTDDQYLTDLEAIDRDADDYLDRARSIERALKDRIRVERSMQPRPRKAEVNLADHARNNGISPTYELPKSDTSQQQTRHTDDDIQTLLLPKDMERKLNAVTSKCRTWLQETGINVLHVAYGFLEWSEPGQTETAYAPLVLCGAQIEKKRTRGGIEFIISGSGEEPEVNAVLAEKLRLDFGIKIPTLDARSIEDYMAEIAKIAPRNIAWKVRRQVAIGVFPSARMSMYHDINPKQKNFPDSLIVQELLAGTNSASALPFAEEYNVDEPSIEECVPYTVMNTDSSQFSALVDLAKGKNLAIEGPPGTGKSQTIVNAIAAALSSGKKVLFVAEKLAALNVVRSRLEAVGLGDFLLPLQAERSTREQVIASVRQRLEMRTPPVASQYDVHLSAYRRARNAIAEYIKLLTTNFDASGMTVHDVLSKSIATSSQLDDIPKQLVENSNLPTNFLTKSGLSSLRILGARLEKTIAQTAGEQTHWKTTRLLHADRFTVEQACDLAARAAKSLRELKLKRDRLLAFGIPATAGIQELKDAHDALVQAAELSDHDKDFLIRLLQPGAAQWVLSFAERCDECRGLRQQIANVLTIEPTPSAATQVELVAAICAESNIHTLDWDQIQSSIAQARSHIDRKASHVLAMEPVVKLRPEATDWALDAMVRARSAAHAAGPSALTLRNAFNIDKASLPVLQRLTAEGLWLQAEKLRLGRLVSLSVEASAETISLCILQIRASGIFSVFSSKYRRAKQVTRGLLLSERFVKQDALFHLEALSVFRMRERSFVQDPSANRLFGEHFNGIDTDFAHFQLLAKYLELIQTSFNGYETRGLRAFLLEADVNELLELPSLPIDLTPSSVTFLRAEIQQLGAALSAVDVAAKSLHPHLSLFVSPKTTAPSSLVEFAQSIVACCAHQHTLQNDERAAALLRSNFSGAETETSNLRRVCTWALNAASVAHHVAAALSGGNFESASTQIANVLTCIASSQELRAQLGSAARIDLDLLLANRSDEESAAILEAAAADSSGLFAHSELASVLEELRQLGLDELTNHARASNQPPSYEALFEAVAVRKVARAVFEKYRQDLTKFSGSHLDGLRAELALHDLEIIKLAQMKLRRDVHANSRPPRGNGQGKKSTWTDLALVENEISKQQRFISVRDLTQRAGKALLELKPCWMMSPLSVAQYIPKDAITFDLCIIDEASQMPPESAIGALLRSKQVMVVGDTNQLPPSSFFRKLVDDDEADEDDSVLNESILEMANATFRPARRLRWHYRSRHSGLIQFSNSLVYKNDLIVFPSATESLARMGVKFQKVEGLYKAGTNAVEARTMVDAILEFMRTDPGRSLGVVTLNQKQRDLIAEEFEYALSNDSKAQEYVETWKARNDGLEEFFIKNLENVQGDERDVIFIGTVYGRESVGGRVYQRFGPINGLAGKRRLNVLFSRAKEKIVTFSSMTAADIVSDGTTNPGTDMFKRWLEYSATGVLDGGHETEKEPDSDFEVFVIEQIRAMGCTPIAQVGVAGYFVDIGVRHPDWPHGFILGVECDGASYHSSKSARDRDRLRQEVLEHLGWRFHRIWSTDWFNDPRKQAERLRLVIAQRLEELKVREREFSSTPKTGASTIKPAREAHAIQGDLPFESSQQTLDAPSRSRPRNVNAAVVGDTVQVRYLTGDCSVLRVTISSAPTDRDKGIVNIKSPIAKALLGAEAGDEVEVLNGSYVRSAIVESVQKGGG